MGLYRIKRKVGGEPFPGFYQRKVEEIEEFKRKEERGEIEIRYVDESGFCLIPYVPYAWQETGHFSYQLSVISYQLSVISYQLSVPLQ